MGVVADRIFTGGTILTMDPLTPQVEAVAVIGDRIFAMGARADILDYKGSKTEEIDLAGATMLPGFVDAHGHPLLTGTSWGDPVIDIRAIHTPTYDAAIAKIKRRVAKAKPGEFLWFIGLDAALHQGMQEPTMAELNALAPNNPLCVQTSNMHSVYANESTVRLVSNAGDIKAPSGGQIHKDKSTGLPWKFQETAAQMLRGHFAGQLGQGRIEREAKNWVWHTANAGYTTSSEIGLSPGWRAQVEPMVRKANYPLRIVGYERAASLAHEPEAPMNSGDDMFRIIGTKLWADGSPFVGNIWVSKPYLNSDVVVKNMGLGKDHTGHMNFSEADFTAIVMKHAALGRQVATHTQGDRAVETTLNAYELALATYPNAKRPFRLEHCALMTEAQIERAMRLGVVCSFFLAHIYYWGEMLRDAMFGQQRLAHYMPSGTATRAGMRLSQHFDTPMTWPNALLILYLATTRRSRAGNVIGPAEKVDIDAGLRSLTIDAAWQIGMDDRVGSLAPGKYADFVILDRNPRAIDPERLLDVKIKGTWLGGKEMWNASQGGHDMIDFEKPVFAG